MNIYGTDGVTRSMELIRAITFLVYKAMTLFTAWMVMTSSTAVRVMTTLTGVMVMTIFRET
jgi:hypothetical protein